MESTILARWATEGVASSYSEAKYVKQVVLGEGALLYITAINISMNFTWATTNRT